MLLSSSTLVDAIDVSPFLSVLPGHPIDLAPAGAALSVYEVHRAVWIGGLAELQGYVITEKNNPQSKSGWVPIGARGADRALKVAQRVACEQLEPALDFASCVPHLPE